MAHREQASRIDPIDANALGHISPPSDWEEDSYCGRVVRSSKVFSESDATLTVFSSVAPGGDSVGSAGFPPLAVSRLCYSTDPSIHFIAMSELKRASRWS
jgi:hypothetical protein